MENSAPRRGRGRHLVRVGGRGSWRTEVVDALAHARARALAPARARPYTRAHARVRAGTRARLDGFLGGVKTTAVGGNGAGSPTRTPRQRADEAPIGRQSLAESGLAGD